MSHLPKQAKIKKFSKQKALAKGQSRRHRVKEAPYRKVSCYIKSIKRYNLERERRRQVRLLIEKGLTRQQVAETLGISIRTVKRDWARLQPYLKFFKQKRKRREDEIKKLELRYEGLSTNETLKLLKQDLKDIQKSTKLNKKKQHAKNAAST